MAGTVYHLHSLGSKKSTEETQQHQHRSLDLLWKEYFRDPSQWWNNRNSKVRPGYPDFKHKISKEPLWIDDRHNPSWVAEELKSRQAQAGELCETNNKIMPDKGTDFVTLLRTCTKNKDLYTGTRTHDHILKCELLDRCSDALVIMYAKCGALAQAKELIDMHKCRNVSSWNALIAGYARHGQSQDAFDYFERMQREGLSPNARTFTYILKACGTIGAAEKGKQIHDKIATLGLLGDDVVLGTALVDMYAKCGLLTKARQVLEDFSSRDVVVWNALIAGYAQQGQAKQALSAFKCMQEEGFSPDAVTYTCILKACGTIGAVAKGNQIHDEIARRGLLRNNIVLGNALVNMYAKCGALAKAQRVLEELPFQNVVAWNALIAGYAQQGQSEQALNSFKRMQDKGLSPNAVTYTCVLKACGTIGAASKGKQIHDAIVSRGLLGKNFVLGTALVDMYAKCGALAKAQRVLEEFPSRSVATWNALIAGYVQHSQGEQAFHCFNRMKSEGFSPDAVTYACILKACSTIGAADDGKQIHDEILREGLLGKDIMLGNALVDMYAKCGALTKAQQVLEELPSRDVVPWNALIAGYAQHDQGEQALDAFKCMQDDGIPPDRVTYACILKACGTIGALEKGEQIHDEIARQGHLGNDVVLGNALVSMYAKCGALSNAQRVLKELPCQNVASWNAIIAGYAQQGQGEQALNCFKHMHSKGFSPDAVTYACALKACATIGAINKGKQIHDEIETQGLLGSNSMLGNALVDMYAKCGAIAKARQVLEELPSRGVVSWNALIAGYVQQGQGEQAVNCFKLMQHEGIPPDLVTFSCVLNVCSHLGLVEDGHMYFLNMFNYGVKPNLEIYTCMINLFGRAGHLEKAVGVIQQMPSSDFSAVWHALLGACGKWGDVHVGRWAFEHALRVDKSDGAAYVLMANMYAAAGMQESARNIEAMRTENKAWKEPMCALVGD